jgi:hypothetical protein
VQEEIAAGDVVDAAALHIRVAVLEFDGQLRAHR